MDQPPPPPPPQSPVVLHHIENSTSSVDELDVDHQLHRDFPIHSSRYYYSTYDAAHIHIPPAATLPIHSAAAVQQQHEIVEESTASAARYGILDIHERKLQRQQSMAAGSRSRSYRISRSSSTEDDWHAHYGSRRRSRRQRHMLLLQQPNHRRTSTDSVQEHVDQEEEEESLLLAAIQKLPTMDRIKAGVLKNICGGLDSYGTDAASGPARRRRAGRHQRLQAVYVGRLSHTQRARLLDDILLQLQHSSSSSSSFSSALATQTAVRSVEQLPPPLNVRHSVDGDDGVASGSLAPADNHRLLDELRNRFDRASMQLPRIEIRYENLRIHTAPAAASIANFGGDTSDSCRRSMPSSRRWALPQINSEESAADHAYDAAERKRPSSTVVLLDGISGVVRPGRLTLLLGPPGSGKTTLLRALAGRTRNLSVGGKITYNGHTLDEFVAQRTSAYIAPWDGQLHLAEMTVRETLDFSARCQGVGNRYDMLVELLRREKVDAENSRSNGRGVKAPDTNIDAFFKAAALSGRTSSITTDYIIKLLRLERCADTRVGDDRRWRGISGGERKRLTLGEMLVGPSDVLLVDDICTGLDAYTTHTIMKCVRQHVHSMEVTAVVSLVDPTPETFALFDDLILLSHGGTLVYHGPLHSVAGVFADMGFACPASTSIPTFLLEVLSETHQEQYWKHISGEHSYRFISPHQFSDAFQRCRLGERIRSELSIPFDKSRSHPASLSSQKYGIGEWQLFRACLWRERLLLTRNSMLYVLKLVQVCVLSIIAMTLFLRTELHSDTVNDGSVYMGALFIGLPIVMFGGLVEMTLTIRRLPVLYKERDNMLYPAWASSLSTFISRAPLSILDALIWVAFTYYVIGFAPEASRFFKQFLVFALASLMASSLFRCVGAYGKTMAVSSIWAMLIFLVTFVYGGFILSRDNVDGYWRRWGYWSSPMMYAQTALSVNEFLAPRWRRQPTSTAGSAVTSSSTDVGVAVLQRHGLFADEKWYWIGAGALLGFTILFNLLYTLALDYLKPTAPMAGSGNRRSKLKVSIAHASFEIRAAAMHAKEELDVTIQQHYRTESNETGEPFTHVATQYTSSASSATVRTATKKQEAAVAAVTQHPSITSGDDINIEIGSGATLSIPSMSLRFRPLSLVFEHINYFVDIPERRHTHVTTSASSSSSRLQVLRDVSGVFKPGLLTAVMGVSGAGKTSLMDVLAGRQMNHSRGHVQGSISCISGVYVPGPMDRQRIRTFGDSVVGYCQHRDVVDHWPNVTVWESILFSAWFRLPGHIDKRKRMAFATEVMKMVELETVKDELVGGRFIANNTYERSYGHGGGGDLEGIKTRLTIAVEMSANPSIVLMDEPTTGLLGSTSAATIIRVIRKIVAGGRTVACTVNHPCSLSTFQAFDQLLLLNRGGEVIYSGSVGERSHQLMHYFEAIPGVPKIKEGCVNPVTWVLEISEGVRRRQGNIIDLAEIYSSSSLFQSNQEELELLRQKQLAGHGNDSHFLFSSQTSSNYYTQSLGTQLMACVWRQARSHFRHPHNYSCHGAKMSAIPVDIDRIAVTAVVALILGAVFWGQGSKIEHQRDIAAILGAMFAATLFLGALNCNAIQCMVEAKQTIFRRETSATAASIYTAIPLAVAQALAEIPGVLLQTIVYSCILYPMISFTWTPAQFFWFLYFLFCTFLYFTYLGMVVVALTPAAASWAPATSISMMLSCFFYILWTLFCGITIPRARIPVWWRWLYWADPVSWSLYGLMSSQLLLGREKMVMTEESDMPLSMSELLESYFGYRHRFFGGVAATEAGVVLLFAFLFAFTLFVSSIRMRGQKGRPRL